MNQRVRVAGAGGELLLEGAEQAYRALTKGTPFAIKAGKKATKGLASLGAIGAAAFTGLTAVVGSTAATLMSGVAIAAVAWGMLRNLGNIIKAGIIGYAAYKAVNFFMGKQEPETNTQELTPEDVLTPSVLPNPKPLALKNTLSNGFKNAADMRLFHKAQAASMSALATFREKAGLQTDLDGAKAKRTVTETITGAEADEAARLKLQADVDLNAETRAAKTTIAGAEADEAARLKLQADVGLNAETRAAKTTIAGAEADEVQRVALENAMIETRGNANVEGLGDREAHIEAEQIKATRGASEPPSLNERAKYLKRQAAIDASVGKMDETADTARSKVKTNPMGIPYVSRESSATATPNTPKNIVASAIETSADAAPSGTSASILSKIKDTKLGAVASRMSANTPAIGTAFGVGAAGLTHYLHTTQRDYAAALRDEGTIGQKAFSAYNTLNKETQATFMGDIGLSTVDPTGLSILATLAAEGTAQGRYNNWVATHAPHLNAGALQGLNMSLFTAKSAQSKMLERLQRNIPLDTAGQPKELHAAINANREMRDFYRENRPPHVPMMAPAEITKQADESRQAWQQDFDVHRNKFISEMASLTSNPDNMSKYLNLVPINDRFAHVRSLAKVVIIPALLHSTQKSILMLKSTLNHGQGGF